MAEQFEPEKTYALHYEGDRLGVVRKGLYYEGPEAWQVGEIKDGTFYYNGKSAGTIEGLIVTVRPCHLPSPAKPRHRVHSNLSEHQI